MIIDAETDGFCPPNCQQACGLDVHDVHEFFVSLTSGQPAESVAIDDFIHHAMRLFVFFLPDSHCSYF